MRIDILDLMAFGPFSETRLDFSQGDQGLHLVFGNNEAGKSSALRALGDLLYGIPHRTLDAFHHPNPKLRLGARLRKSDQTCLEFVRRKGRSPLRCGNDTKKLDESQLENFRPVADRVLFETMFALNHERLIQGGRHILEGGGRLGELLFEAGTGLGSLQQIQTRLKEQIDALYLPKGRNPAINKLITAWREEREQTKRSLLIADDWNRLARQLSDKRAQLRQLDELIQGEESHHQRLLRLQEAIPSAARRRQLQNELETLGDVIPVQADQLRDVSERLTRREALEAQLADLREEEATLQKQLAEVQVHEAALQEAGSLNHFREWLGSYRKALGDRPELETTRKVTEQRVADALHALGYDLAVGQEHPTVANHIAVRIQDLGTQYDALRERLSSRRKQSSKLIQQLETIEKQRDQIHIVEDIAALEHRTRMLPDPRSLIDQRNKLVTRIAQLETRCQDRIERLPCLESEIEKLVRLKVPSRETLLKHDESLRALRQKLQTLIDRGEENQHALQQLAEQLQVLEKGLQIPTEDELLRLRARRDEQWETLLKRLTGDGSPDLSDSQLQLDEILRSFRTDLDAADEVADRLRREADRVAEKARILIQQDSLHQQLSQLETDRVQAVHDIETAEHAWVELWKGIVESPLSPQEMIAWLELYREVCDLHDEAQSVQLERTQTDIQIRSLNEDVAGLLKMCSAERQRLDSSLQQRSSLSSSTDLETSYESLIHDIETLQSFVQQALLDKQSHDQLAQRCHDLQSEIANAQSEVKEAESEWDAWQDGWRQEMQRLKLPDDALPSQAHSVLTSLAKIAAEVAAVKELDVRIAGIDREASDFERQLKELAERIGFTIDDSSDSPESLAVQLFECLERNLQAHRTREHIVSRLAAVLKEQQKLRSLATEIDASLVALAKQWAVSDVERLLDFARRGERRGNLEAKRDELDETLISLCGGKAIEQLWQEVRHAEPSLEDRESSTHATWDQADIDVLKSWGSSAAARLTKHREERDALIREIERAQAEFEEMNGGGSAATHEQQSQELQIEIAEHVRELQVLRVMETGLRSAMSRYRDQNELPILKRAAELFAQLTADRYLELRLDADEQGEPIVVAIRSTGEMTHVDQMSDGTRDQLYLAIRLASLDQWLENREPMLFVLDDVLLNFDDERAVACLKTFANYAAKTQIIMFTHHAHLVELAQQHVDPGQLFVHQLNAGYPTPS